MLILLFRIRGSHDIIAELDIYFKNQIKKVIKEILISSPNIEEIEYIIIDGYHTTENLCTIFLHINKIDMKINNENIIVDYIDITIKFALLNRELIDIIVNTENTIYETERDIPSPEEQDKLDETIKNIIKIQIKKKFYKEDIWKKIISEEIDFQAIQMRKIFETPVNKLLNLLEEKKNKHYDKEDEKEN